LTRKSAIQRSRVSEKQPESPDIPTASALWVVMIYPEMSGNGRKAFMMRARVAECFAAVHGSTIETSLGALIAAGTQFTVALMWVFVASGL